MSFAGRKKGRGGAELEEGPAFKFADGDGWGRDDEGAEDDKGLFGGDDVVVTTGETKGGRARGDGSGLAGGDGLALAKHSTRTGLGPMGSMSSDGKEC